MITSNVTWGLVVSHLSSFLIHTNYSCGIYFNLFLFLCLFFQVTSLCETYKYEISLYSVFIWHVPHVLVHLMFPDLCSLKKQIENENHESFQILHAQSVTFCLQSSVIHLDIHMWWWEHISAPLYPLQTISTFFAKHSPDDAKHVSVQISHWFFTILLNWYRMSLVSCLLQAMNLNLQWVKGYTTFPMICISYWQNRNAFSCYVLMWLIGFIFLRTEFCSRCVFVMLLLPLNNMRDLRAVFV